MSEQAESWAERRATAVAMPDPCVVTELVETPDINQHPNINAAEALTEAITTATLETMEMARFGLKGAA